MCVCVCVRVWQVPVRAADKLFTGEWHSLQAQAGSLSSLSITHTDASKEWAVIPSSVGYLSAPTGGQGRMADLLAALQDELPATGFATMPATQHSGLPSLTIVFPAVVTVTGIDVAALGSTSSWDATNVNGAVVQASYDEGHSFTDVHTISGVAASGTSSQAFANTARAKWFRITHPTKALALSRLAWDVIQGSGLAAHALDVRVQVRSADGFVFEGDGATHRGDAQNANSYGGVVYGWTTDAVRMFTPSRRSGSAPGYAVHVANGWGGGSEQRTESSASVRVLAAAMVAADFDSGWRLMSSVIPDAPRFLEVDHGFGGLPAHVEVLVRADTGELAGSVFKAAGACQTNGNSGQYGGVVFGYSGANVRVWAASNSNGYPAIVRDGWRGTSNPFLSDVVSVRVKAWRSLGSPDFEDTVTMTADSDAFKQLGHGLGVVPGRVKVVVSPPSGNNAGYVSATGLVCMCAWLPHRESCCLAGTTFHRLAWHRLPVAPAATRTAVLCRRTTTSLCACTPPALMPATETTWATCPTWDPGGVRATTPAPMPPRLSRCKCGATTRW